MDSNTILIDSGHRGFLESPGPQNSCDHLNNKWHQLPHWNWCVHACNFHALWESAGSWLSLNAFKWSQKILFTIKRARSLKNLYDSGSNPTMIFFCVMQWKCHLYACTMISVYGIHFQATTTSLSRRDQPTVSAAASRSSWMLRSSTRPTQPGAHPGSG